MSDPHVVALHYRVVAGPLCDFDQAPPLKHEEVAFAVEVAGSAATFTMKEHFASESEARAAVQPFIDAWYVVSDLENDAGAFRLEFERADVIDRAATLGSHQIISVGSTAIGTSAANAIGHTRYGHFPEPAVEFHVSREVGIMHWQYKGYRQGKIPLPHMCYFILTILEYHSDWRSDKAPKMKNTSKKRSSASRKWRIHLDVLNKIGTLTSERGGLNARKAEGLQNELTSSESTWLEASAKMMIRRAGEVAANPAGPHRQLTFSDFPPL